MPFEIHSRVREPFAWALDLPPPFRAVGLREAGDSFAHAQSIADDAGAGTLVHVGRFDLVDFAIVLEPDEPLRTARRALYAGMVALADALAVLAPPEKPISFDWPDAVRIDGGLVGGARLTWPADADENAAPRWLVVGAMIRTAAMGVHEPGAHPFSAALDAEGFDTGSGRLLEGFARHLMTVIDAWQHEGFRVVSRSYLSRLAPQDDARYELAENGDLLIRRVAGLEVERRSLLPGLAAPSWLDPSTGSPRL
jgi:hypothetical protein